MTTPSTLAITPTRRIPVLPPACFTVIGRHRLAWSRLCD